MGTNVSVKLMNTVEDFYDLAEPYEANDQDDDYDDDYTEMGLSEETAAAFAKSMEHPTEINMKSITCCDNEYVKNSKVNCKEVEEVTNRRVCVNTSPSFQIKVANGRKSKEELVLDTGCTAESIVNKDFADSLGLPITPTNVQSATLGDGETAMTILGECFCVL